MDASTLYRELLDMGVGPEVINEYIYQYGAVEGCRVAMLSFCHIVPMLSLANNRCMSPL